MQTEQIGNTAAQRPSVLVDAPFPNLAHYSGLLGNQRAQAPALTATTEFVEVEVWLLGDLSKRFAQAQPASRLAILKRHKFTPEGREQRVRASLAALNAAQLTTLTLEQWKEVIEEAEEDDED